MSTETLQALHTLWDPEDGRVDLRQFSIEALEALHLGTLRDCEEARYVALPAHCPAQVLHSLLIGLPQLEGLMAWSPSDPDAVRLVMGRHLTTFVSDAATVQQVMPVDGIKPVAGSGPDLSVDAFAATCGFATLRRPHPVTAAAPSVRRVSSTRPLSLFLGEVPTATASAAVGQRLANWYAPAAAVSRPPVSLPITPPASPRTSPGTSPDATSVNTPAATPRGSPRSSSPGSPRDSTQRSWQASARTELRRDAARSVSGLLRDCEAALRKLSRWPLRRSQSV